MHPETTGRLYTKKRRYQLPKGPKLRLCAHVVHTYKPVNKANGKLKYWVTVASFAQDIGKKSRKKARKTL